MNFYKFSCSSTISLRFEITIMILPLAIKKIERKIEHCRCRHDFIMQSHLYSQHIREHGDQQILQTMRPATTWHNDKQKPHRNSKFAVIWGKRHLHVTPIFESRLFSEFELIWQGNHLIKSMNHNPVIMIHIWN